jgi:hypothetical protein
MVNKYINAKIFMVNHKKLIMLSAIKENITKKPSFDLMISCFLFMEKVGILLTNKALIKII